MAFLLGATSIASDFALPWLPAILVACYGGSLLYAEIKGHVSHSDLTNNSPYFLGFVLFLFSLFVTFTRYGRQPEQMQMAFVIRQLGASLLTTIVGLPFRQWLFAYDPGQQDQDLFYHTLEEELRRSAAEFKKSQVELVGLVEQFVETRKTLFADEQIASEQYINNLKRAVSVFDNNLTEYPSLISTAVQSCTKVLGTLRTKIDTFSTTIAAIDSVQLQQAATEFQSLKTHASALNDGLFLLTQTVGGLTTRANAVPQVVAEVFDSASRITGAGVIQIKDQLSVLIRDIEDVDKLISEFVEMQTLKVTGK